LKTSHLGWGIVTVVRARRRRLVLAGLLAGLGGLSLALSTASQ